MGLAIFERLKGRRRAAEQRNAETFEQLVSRVAADQATEADIETALKELGWTETQLESAVVLLLKRKDWQAQADELPAITKALADVQTAVDRANSEFAERLTALRNEHGAEIENLRQQGALLNSKLNAATNSISRLNDTVPSDIRRRVDEVYREIKTRQDEVHSLANRAGVIRGSGFGSMMPADNSKSRIKVLKAEIAELTQKSAAIQAGAWT